MSRFYAKVQRNRRAAVEAAGPPAPRIDPRAPGGDEKRLRAIPVIGRGCGGGAIPGTRPGDTIRR